MGLLTIDMLCYDWCICGLKMADNSEREQKFTVAIWFCNLEREEMKVFQMGTRKAKWGCGCGREITQIRRFKWTHKLINFFYLKIRSIKLITL